MSAVGAWIRDRLGSRTRRGRAHAFAARYFPRCRAHAREAAALHRVLERLSPKPRPVITADLAIADVVGTHESPHFRNLDFLEVVELVEALEAEWGVSRSRERTAATDAAWGALLSRWLLGSSPGTTTWDAETILARSVRGIIDERVRRAGGCACAVPERV